MPWNEALETRATRKLSSKTLNKLPSPILFKAKNQLAQNIQRSYRNKRRRTKRKGSKITSDEMKRQLCDFWCNLDPDQTFEDYLLGPFFQSIDILTLSEPDKIKFLINNLSRPLLENLYNKSNRFDENDEEDPRYIDNTMFFPQSTRGGKKSKKTRKRKS